jgi:ATP-binding cassette subfamily B protein
MSRLRPDRLRLAAGTLLGVASAALFVTGPKILGHATDILFAGLVSRSLPAGVTKAQAIAGLRSHGHGQLATMFSAMDITPGHGVDFARFGRTLGLAAVLYLCGAGFSWAQGYLMAGVAQRTVYGMREAVEAKLARLPLRYFDSRPHGEILGLVTNDIDNLNTTLQQGLNQLLTSVLTVLGILVMMFWISPLLATISLAIIPLSIGLTSGIARRSKAHFIAQWHWTARLNGLVEESHTGHALVSVFGQRRPMSEDFSHRNDQLYQAGFRAEFLSGTVQPAVQFLGNLNYVVIAALGGYRVATGVFTLGDVQAFIQYSRQFTTPVSQIASQLNQLQSGLASAQRVFDFLAMPEEPVVHDTAVPERIGDELGGSAPARLPVAYRVDLERVSFRYEAETPLIEDFTLHAAPGQTVAIVGPTGAGKTTVVNLLMRFYEIDGGRILLNGTDYRSLGRDQVRRCFGMVLQDTWLFAGTIRENIAYGRDGASEEDVIAAARAAQAEPFIRALPQGYDTVLDPDTSAVSSGQKQLLTIARAFLANPGILILDEATSNVDTRTEAAIQRGMARLRRGRTSFVIAHRLSTVRNADTIVVMSAGRIVEQGGHDQLLHDGTVYRDLYNSQFAQQPAW